MKKRLSISLTVLLTLLLAGSLPPMLTSCSTADDLAGSTEQSSATLTVKISQQNTTVVTRAISDAIENVHILVFDGQGHLIGSTYASSTPTSVTVPVRVASGCTVCAVANTGNISYFDGVSTLTELKAKVTPVIATAAALGSKSNEILYGETTGVTLTSGTTTQSVSLKRLYSKYTFTITPISDITITGYQLCHVPNECYIASGNSANPSTNYSALDFSAVTTSSAAGAAVSATYYVYENLAGKNSAVTSAALRTAANVTTAAPNASYLLINAKGTGFKSEYRIYLGGVTSATTPVADPTDFNVYRNYDYKCNIEIAGSGQGDARVTYTAVATGPSVGDIYFSDGTYSSTLISGKTPIGVIVSTNSTYREGKSHGLVMALKDASTSAIWCSGSASGYSSTHTTVVTDIPTFISNSSGLTNTNTMTGLPDYTSSNYPVFYAVKTYTPTGTSSSSGYLSSSSGWFLPSSGQFYEMMVNAQTYNKSGSSVSETTTFPTTGSFQTIASPAGTNTCTEINYWFSSKGLATTTYDAFSASNYYRTSSECSADGACIVYFASDGILYLDFSYKDGDGWVRPFLAF